MMYIHVPMEEYTVNFYTVATLVFLLFHCQPLKVWLYVRRYNVTMCARLMLV